MSGKAQTSLKRRLRIIDCRTHVSSFYVVGITIIFYMDYSFDKNNYEIKLFMYVHHIFQTVIFSTLRFDEIFKQ